MGECNALGDIEREKDLATEDISKSPVGPEPIEFKIEYCATKPEISHFESTGTPGSHFGFTGSPKARSSLKALSRTMYFALGSRKSFRGKLRAGTC